MVSLFISTVGPIFKTQSGASCHTPTMLCMVGGVAGLGEIHGLLEQSDEQCL